MELKRIKISDIVHKPYGHVNKHCIITNETIQHAINAGNLDPRGFQSHKEELAAYIFCTNNHDEILERYNTYHNGRIAYMVGSELRKEPIKVEIENGKYRLLDGQHRIWAAKYLGEDEIDAEIVFV